MSRRRKERRADPAQRAVARGDVTSLRSLLERSPTAGARAVAGLARAGTGESERRDELDDLLADALAALRDRGEVALALELCSAGGRRTTLLRLEEALAAFSHGDDARVAELAGLDADVKRVMAPMIAATSGGRFPTAKPSSPSLAEVTRLSRAVHAVRAGKLAVALDALDGASPLGVRLGAPELRLAAQLDLDALGERDVDAHARRLEASSLLDDAGAATLRAITRERHLALRGAGRGRRTAGARDTVGPATPQELAALARDEGPEVFVPEDRGMALLYAAFASIGIDSRRALRDAEAAARAGADAGECARARFLALTSPSAEVTSATLTDALERLRATYGRAPHGRYLVAAAAEDAIALLSGGEALRPLQQAIATLREAEGDGDETTRYHLCLGEAVAELERRPARAAELAEQATTLRPEKAAAWLLLADAVRDLGQSALSVLERGAAATKDDRLARELREERRATGAPLPDAPTAGELASELLRLRETDAWTGGPYPASVAAGRSRLPAEQRGLVDAGAVAIEKSFGGPNAAMALATRLLADDGVTELAADMIVDTLRREGMPPADALELLHAATEDGKGSTIAVVASAVAAVYPTIAHQVALRHGPALSRSALDRITKPRDVTGLYDRVHDALHPTFCISTVDQDHAGLLDGAPPPELAALEELVDAAPNAELEALMKNAPPGEARRVLEALRELAQMAAAPTRPRVTGKKKKR